MLHLLESRQRRPPHPLRRRIRRLQLRMSRLQVLQLPQQPVEFPVRDFRLRLHVIQMIVPRQLRAQKSRALCHLCRCLNRPFHTSFIAPPLPPVQPNQNPRPPPRHVHPQFINSGYHPNAPLTRIMYATSLPQMQGGRGETVLAFYAPRPPNVHQPQKCDTISLFIICGYTST